MYLLAQRGDKVGIVSFIDGTPRVFKKEKAIHNFARNNDLIVLLILRDFKDYEGRIKV